jgi:hypothetical protein
MKKNFIKIVAPLILGIALISTSCKKYLYSGPISSTYSAQFWTSQTSVEQATLAMYGQLRTNLRATGASEAAHFVNGDLVAGTFTPVSGSFLGYSLVPNPTSSSYNHGIPFYFGGVPYWESTLHNWSRYYQLIAQANLVLQNVPKMPASAFTSEAVRNKYIAEALFMRAYTYFYMIRIWGDPVYVNKLYSDIDYGNIPPVARTAESIVLDSCLTDLKTAANYFNVPSPGTAAIRANAGSNDALIAHIYAWKNNYDSAHVYCQKVINNYGYRLEPMSSYTNLWKGMGSAENIFELSMQVNNNDPNFKQGATNSWTEAQFNCFATFLKSPYLPNNIKTTCWVAPAGGLVQGLTTTAGFIQPTPQNPSGAGTGSLFVDTTRDARFRQILLPVAAANNDPKGYLMTKYSAFAYQDSVKKILPYINNNLVLLRLSDIILLDAEALANLGDLNGANAQLAKTESRAGLLAYTPTDKTSMLVEIVKERGREFIGEGSWFYDLIRTESQIKGLEKVGYTSPGRTDPTLKGWYWPLAMTTLFPQDNLLTQNPYFLTH